MNAINVKYYIGILFIFIVDSLHNIFFDNNSKIDVYLFYEHERYLTNILYDISNMFKFTLMSYWLIKVNRAVFRRLFHTSLLIYPLYFLFYNQIESLIIIPCYLILLYIYKLNLIKYIKNENPSKF